MSFCFRLVIITIKILTDFLLFSRVAELEQENARLKAAADGLSPPPDSVSDRSSVSHSEYEHLRAQLASARQREQELAEQLERIKYQAQQVKTESQEPALSSTSSDGSSSGPSTPLMTPSSFPLSMRGIPNAKSGASLGLMVSFHQSLYSRGL